MKAINNETHLGFENDTEPRNIYNKFYEIYSTDQAEFKKECAFQDYATPLIREKFNIRFDFSFAHLANPEIKNYIKQLRSEFN